MRDDAARALETNRVLNLLASIFSLSLFLTHTHDTARTFQNIVTLFYKGRG